MLGESIHTLEEHVISIKQIPSSIKEFVNLFEQYADFLKGVFPATDFVKEVAAFLNVSVQFLKGFHDFLGEND